MWDRHGSGREDAGAYNLEEQVVARLEKLGVARDRVLAVALNPELECLFRKAWSRVKEIVVAERGCAVPGDAEILAEARRANPRLWPVGKGELEDELEEGLVAHPKELFEALVRLVRLRRTAPLYERIGAQVSLRALKKVDEALRVAKALSSWFPSEQNI
jgi:hypothetical protein